MQCLLVQAVPGRRRSCIVGDLPHLYSVYLYRLYLEDEDHVQGESYLNRAAQLQTQTKNEELLIIYKVCKYKEILISRFPSLSFDNSYISSIYLSI